MTDWIGKNRDAIAILRVSSHRQSGNTSHDTQEKEIISYNKTLGLNLVQIFRVTESAKDSDKRRQYGAAIKKALDSDIRHIEFYMYDREARNLTVSSHILGPGQSHIFGPPDF